MTQKNTFKCQKGRQLAKKTTAKTENRENKIFYFFMIGLVDVYFDITIDDIIKKGFNIAVGVSITGAQAIFI